jgi:hypothetical protein
MKTIITIITMKTMKTMKQNYFLKAAGIVAILVVMSSQAVAQSKVNVTKLPNAVKVIDSKGTIKYFQSNNGITQIVNSTTDVTVTTWQLGGTLTDDTYIDATGKAFGLKGLGLTTSKASADGVVAGYTLLVSDAITGKMERVVATDLIQGGVADDELTTTKTAVYTILGTTGLTSVANRISVFRNGIKLRATDWALASGAITITPTAELPLYAGDVLNVQWVK